MQARLSARKSDRFRCPACGASRGLQIESYKEKPFASCWTCRTKSAELLQLMGHAPVVCAEIAHTTQNGEYISKLWDNAIGVMDACGWEKTTLTRYMIDRFCTTDNARACMLALHRAGCRVTEEALQGRKIVTLLAPIRFDNGDIASMQRTFISERHPSGDKRRTMGRTEEGFMVIKTAKKQTNTTVLCEGLEKALAVSLCGADAVVAFGQSRMTKVAKKIDGRLIIFCDNDKPTENAPHGGCIADAIKIAKNRPNTVVIAPPKGVKDADEWLRVCKGDKEVMEKYLLKWC